MGVGFGLQNWEVNFLHGLTLSFGIVFCEAGFDLVLDSGNFL